MKPVYSLDLSPRYNVYAKPIPIIDVHTVIGGVMLAFLLCVIAVLLFTF